ncbi:MAG TPA: alkaline phosphatase D family protein [Thermoleophilaceae bacterium]|nr:alkaline phosphatase D family protein [Thermoleophilaceae bacterium]
MPRLVLGPLLRHVGETDAVVWVETDRSCDVEFLGGRERTFSICGRHYALVQAEGLRPGSAHEYEIRLDGKRVWPLADSEFPPSRFRTLPADGPVRIVFGSCRVAAPHQPPYTLRKDEDQRGREVDALRTLALRMLEQPPAEWPDLLLMLGDQVYADEVSPATAAFAESRRDTSEPPGERVVDYEEYARLYHESWSDPVIRWLLSTVSTAMIFDDHDVHDDWNISQAWVEEIRRTDWWNEHVVAALMSYWVYQHLGNLGPGDHREDELLRQVKSVDDGSDLLREFAYRADRTTDGARWSYCRDVGDSRILVIDSRAGRVLDEGRRSMLDAEEWDWITEHATGGFDHLLFATSLPFLLGRGMHYAEAWSEAVAGGAWGRIGTGLGERVRVAMDMEHWAAFQRSFAAFAELQRSVAAGERGPPPASIVTLSGDVHHAYLFEVGYPSDSGVRSAVWQAVCSPFRNPLDARERRMVRLAMSRPAATVARALARAAGVADPKLGWQLTGGGPWFDNQVAMLTINGRAMDLRLEKAVPIDDHSARLECVLEQTLAS